MILLKIKKILLFKVYVERNRSMDNPPQSFYWILLYNRPSGGPAEGMSPFAEILYKLFSIGIRH